MGTLEQITNIQNNLYKACNFKLTHFLAEHESSEYFAHSYNLDENKIRFRIAKKTPTKTGWFVTLWKRNAEGITAPYDKSDPIDFFIINIVSDKIGQFIFPKSILLEKGIFSQNKVGGKRGIRVYSPWDEAHNPQAKRTKAWQERYFVELCIENINRFKALYSQTHPKNIDILNIN